LSAYIGQEIELYSSDPEDDEVGVPCMIAVIIMSLKFFRCCAMVEEALGLGRVNNASFLSIY